MSEPEPPWIDISVPVMPGRIPTWPRSPAIKFERRLSLAGGDNADDTTVTMSVHTGTHLDAPRHFVPGGATVDQLPLSTFTGPCQVVDCRGRAAIDALTLERAEIPENTRRLLLKTDNEHKWAPEFDESFVGVTVDGAQWLARRRLALVGIDYLSIQPYHETDQVHRAVLGAGTAILEGLTLEHVEPGPYLLMCLPIKLCGTEGAWARALLLPPGHTLGAS